MSSGGRGKRRVHGNKPSSDIRSLESDGANSDNAEQLTEPLREKEKERRVRKAKATRWTSKGNKKSFQVGGVVGRRICKDVTVSHYYFYLECLDEFTIHGDASEKIYAAETHSFKVEETQYKIFEADKPKKFMWLFMEEMENCEVLIRKFEDQWREELRQSQMKKVEAENKIRREKAALDEEDRIVRARLAKTGFKNLEQPRSNIYDWSPSCSSDDEDYSQQDRETWEKSKAENADGRFGDTDEEEKYVREPRDDQIKRSALVLFKDSISRQTPITDEELLHQFYECDDERSAHFINLARTSWNARAELIIKRRLGEDERRSRRARVSGENRTANADNIDAIIEDLPMGDIDHEETITEEIVEPKRKKRGRKAKPSRTKTRREKSHVNTPIDSSSAVSIEPQGIDSVQEQEERIRDEKYAKCQSELEDSYLKAPTEEELTWIARCAYLDDVREDEMHSGKAVVERDYELVTNDFEESMNNDPAFREMYLAKGQAAWDKRALETLAKRERERMQGGSNHGGMPSTSMRDQNNISNMDIPEERMHSPPDAGQMQQEDDEEIFLLYEGQGTSSHGDTKDSIYNKYRC